MHAAVEAREVESQLAETQAAVGVGIEQPHLDVRMRIERRERRVQPARVVVVEQQPHPHAAFGRLPQRLAQESAGRVVAQDVVLDVEAAIGGAREQDARSECVARVAERVHAGPAGVGRQRRGQAAAEARAAGVGQRSRGCALDAAGQRGAAGAGSEQDHERGRARRGSSRHDTTSRAAGTDHRGPTASAGRR